jgi:chromosome segregation ATPase
MNELDHRSIIALSQQCTEDLTVKMREKNALSDLLSELKKKKMQYDARTGKKKREVDTTVVQTMEMEKKLQQLNNANKMMNAELSGLRKANELLEGEVEHLRQNFKEATLNYEKECSDVETVKRRLYSYRKEINGESKLRESVQQDLRASRTAQSLMINRLDDMEKRNRALKTCVANTFNNF